MLEDVLPWLTCPHCQGRLRIGGASLICSSGHTMNVARQGYASLLGRDAGTHTADSAEMIAARERVFRAGFFDPLIAAVREAAARPGIEGVEGAVLDLGSGPGNYLAAVLDELPARNGIALDNSKFAARRAARAHPGAGAIVADIWDRLPVADRSVAVLINVFAPRNGEEMSRVLAEGGRTVVVTPQPDHLGELVEPFGMISVDPEKDARLERSLDALEGRSESAVLTWRFEAGRDLVADLVAMGPSAGRLEPDRLQAALEGLPEKTAVTGSVRIRIT